MVGHGTDGVGCVRLMMDLDNVRQEAEGVDKSQFGTHQGDQVLMTLTKAVYGRWKDEVDRQIAGQKYVQLRKCRLHFFDRVVVLTCKQTLAGCHVK